MGKKSKILYYTVLLVNLACFVLDLLPIDFPFFRISFAVTLILIGLLLIARAFNYKIDSSMFFGCILFLCGILNMLAYFGKTFWDWSSNQFWPYYVFAVALASLVTGAYFKDKLQFKIFVLFLGFGILTLLFVQKIFGLWWFVGLMILWFVIYFTVNTIIYKRKRKNV
ncbi:MAG: hypothetical protein E7374_00075 [Clostridiales bacterium]|nr:hypothetical protein [Clostridiales bacterium]